MKAAALIPVYRRRQAPLHDARAASALLYLAGIGTLAFVFSNPLLLAVELLSLLLVARLTGALADLAGFVVSAVVLALLIAMVNPLVSHEGLTLLLRGPAVPVLGSLDVTLEAGVFGVTMGLRVVVAMLAFGLYTVAVDPDEVLKIFRRWGFRSALTTSVATRMVPVLGRDAQRLGEAQGCRAQAEEPAGRLARLRDRAPVLRALVTNALERSTDTAMALEVRGFGRSKPSVGPRAPWSLNDCLFAVSGLCLFALAVAGVVAGAGQFQFYPRLGSPVELDVALLAIGVVAIFGLPFFGGHLLKRHRWRRRTRRLPRLRAWLRRDPEKRSQAKDWRRPPDGRLEGARGRRKDVMSSPSDQTCRDLLSSSAERVRAGVETMELEEAPYEYRNGT